MSVRRLYNDRHYFPDASGNNALSGGKLYIYLSGTSTKATTWNSSLGNFANSNPMTLDAAGRLQSELWVTTNATYKLLLTSDTTNDPPLSSIWTEDVISGIGDFPTSAITGEWIASASTPTYISANSFSVTGDQTAILDEGVRLKIVDAGGTKYASITNSTFGAVTTVTVLVDGGGSLSNPVSSFSYGILAAANTSIPAILQTGVINTQQATDLASAATLNLDVFPSASGNLLRITGTTNISAVTLTNGRWRYGLFTVDGGQITAGGTLVPPGAANFPWKAGDVVLFFAIQGIVYAQPINRGQSRLPTVQKFTTGSGTYTTPAGTTRIKVSMVGGGGGGGGSCAFANNNGGTGGTGGNTTWAATLLVANGATGGGGTISSAAGSGGSTSSTAGPIIIVSLSGSGGQAGSNSNTANVAYAGGIGGPSPYGGVGRGGPSGGVAGGAAQANSGSGGGGSGIGAQGVSGGGGGSGGYIEALITTPAASYAYAVGAAGAAGIAGTGGFVGGAGGDGYIVVEEFYD